MADKIKANDYTSINQSAESVSSDTTNTESTLQTTTSSSKKATTSSSTEHKRDISQYWRKISFIYYHWNHLTIFS